MENVCFGSGREAREDAQVSKNKVRASATLNTEKKRKFPQASFMVSDGEGSRPSAHAGRGRRAGGGGGGGKESAGEAPAGKSLAAVR